MTLIASVAQALGEPWPLTGAPGPWHVLHTLSRQEKALAEDLRAMGIPHYLPLVSRVKAYGQRRAVIDVPLFPGYLFLKGASEQAYRADRTRRVAQVLRVADQAGMDWELTNLRIALSRQAELTAYSGLHKGVRVEVIAGHLRGLQGIVERDGGDRIFLQVRMLGQSVTLDVECGLLRTLD